MTTLFHVTIDTPLGYMRPVSDGSCLIRLDCGQSRFSAPDNPDDVSRETSHQLIAYLGGTLKDFRLPVQAERKSATGHAWLEAMAHIPYGALVTYAEFAAAAGKLGTPRAAGTTCSTNPIPIIYSCHRVVRVSRALRIYGGSSYLDPKHLDNLGRKQALIDLERQFA